MRQWLAGLLQNLALRSDYVERTVTHAHNVEVKVYVEAGCPYSQAFMKDLRDVMEDSKFATNTALAVVFWGNSYYSGVNACSVAGNGDWNRSSAKCWRDTCLAPGASALSQPSSCFGPGVARHQHGDLEGEVDRVASCAQRAAGNDASHGAPPWLRITTCLLEDYPAKNSTIGANDLLTNCATKTSFPDVITEEALACLAGPLAEQLEGEAASHTPPHPGVPYVLLDGKALDPEAQDFRTALCKKIDPSDGNCDSTSVSHIAMLKAKDAKEKEAKTAARTKSDEVINVEVSVQLNPHLAAAAASSAVAGTGGVVKKLE